MIDILEMILNGICDIFCGILNAIVMWLPYFLLAAGIIFLVAWGGSL